MQVASVEIEAVIFDWGGTLTPWRPIDYRGEALALASYAEPERVDEVADAVFAAGAQVWGRSRDEHRSATLAELCALAGIEPTTRRIDDYRAFWEPATITDPDVRPLWEGLRAAGTQGRRAVEHDLAAGVASRVLRSRRRARPGRRRRLHE